VHTDNISKQILWEKKFSSRVSILHSNTGQTSFTRMNSPVSVFTNLRQDRWSVAKCFSEAKQTLKRNRGNLSLHNSRVENVIKQLVHMLAVLHQNMKHFGSLESTQEAGLPLKQLLRIFHALQTSHMPHILMKQLTYEPIVNWSWQITWGIPDTNSILSIIVCIFFCFVLFLHSDKLKIQLALVLYLVVWIVWDK